MIKVFTSNKLVGEPPMQNKNSTQDSSSALKKPKHFDKRNAWCVM